MSWAIKIEYKRLYGSPLETEYIGRFESLEEAKAKESAITWDWIEQHDPMFRVTGSAVYMEDDNEKDDEDEKEVDEAEDEETETFVVKVTTSRNGAMSPGTVMDILNDRAYDCSCDGLVYFDYTPISVADLSEFGFVKKKNV